MSELERVYTIPLKRSSVVPRTKRTPKAIRVLRAFIKRHMKATEIVIGNDVNELIWSRGIRTPPRYVKVKAVKDKEGIVTVSLAEES